MIPSKESFEFQGPRDKKPHVSWSNYMHGTVLGPRVIILTVFSLHSCILNPSNPVLYLHPGSRNQDFNLGQCKAQNCRCLEIWSLRSVDHRSRFVDVPLPCFSTFLLAQVHNLPCSFVQLFLHTICMRTPCSSSTVQDRSAYKDSSQPASLHLKASATVADRTIGADLQRRTSKGQEGIDWPSRRLLQGTPIGGNHDAGNFRLFTCIVLYILYVLSLDLVWYVWYIKTDLTWQTLSSQPALVLHEPSLTAPILAAPVSNSLTPSAHCRLPNTSWSLGPILPRWSYWKSPKQHTHTPSLQAFVIWDWLWAPDQISHPTDWDELPPWSCARATTHGVLLQLDRAQLRATNLPLMHL